MNPDHDRRPAALLLDPFVYIAGAKALALGLLTILLAGGIGALGRTHFDGVLDTHTGARAPVWFFLSEGIVDWLCLAVVLLVMGAIVSRTAFRIIDVLGTQALARWPTVLIALATLPEGFRRFSGYLLHQLVRPAPGLEFSAGDAAIFAVGLTATIVLTVGFIFLMYRAYSISCNVKGGKAIGTFIAALLIAEILSKIALFSLAKLV